MVQQKQAAYLGVCVFVVFYIFQNGHELEHYAGLFIASRGSSTSALNHLAKQKPRNLLENNIYYNGTQALVNKWYGWQPEISESMECSWKECFASNHTCKSCRDSLDDMNVTNSSSIDPGPDWVPDVTMLRRMYMDGHDANGNPWPPPLDEELCRALGNDDFQKTKEALDVIPIKSYPLPRPIPENDNSKVLCMIYTMEKKHGGAIRAMRETWAPMCDGFLAFSTKTDPRIPAISIPHRGKEEYGNMWQKIRSMWQFAGRHYLSQFNWFYIGGDDLFPLFPNLKRLLSTFNSSESHFLGRRFKPKKDGVEFNTGGPGYALSRPAVECFMEHIEEPLCKPWKKTAMEDVMIADCLKKTCNITCTETRDDQLRQRFHHYSAGWVYTYKGRLPWYNMYSRLVGGVLKGKNCCAPDTAAFHDMPNPALMRYVHNYVHFCNRSVPV